MSELPRLLLGTVQLRPYVFVFLGVYLLAATSHLGWRRALLFIPVGYWLAWLSEFASIHWGFPYGDYFYIEQTRHQELWAWGVPFMDSLSYVFLSYCSYATALVVVAPIKIRNGDFFLLETHHHRRSVAVLVLGSFLFVFLDIIIDPVALQGSRWFLGQIYGYRVEGIYFGIPLSNFHGWLLVGFVLIGTLQVLDRWHRLDSVSGRRLHRLKRSDGLGVALYVGILAFNLAVTWWIGESFQALVGALLVFYPTLLVLVFLRYKNRYLPRQAITDHVRDFPDSRAQALMEPDSGDGTGLAEYVT